MTDVPELESAVEQRVDRVSDWLKVLTVLVALCATGIALGYARQPLVETYAFRQTQTAITAFWMMRNGWHLAYETPVAGYPWSIPFEFPLYQMLVAVIGKASGLSLDAVGRMVSFVFLLGCAWPARAIASRLALPRQTIWYFAHCCGPVRSICPWDAHS
jgi:hypothetical protein